MGRRHIKPEQIIHMLREAEIKLAGGKTAGEVCRELGISKQSYYRWRKEYGGIQVSQAKRLKDLEREAQRNVELIWLTGRLMPAFKTIADFRKDNSEAICTVCLEFIELCCELQLLSARPVAIDGSKFKAVNSRDNNYTSKSVKRRMRTIRYRVSAS